MSLRKMLLDLPKEPNQTLRDFIRSRPMLELGLTRQRDIEMCLLFYKHVSDVPAIDFERAIYEFFGIDVNQYHEEMKELDKVRSQHESKETIHR